MSIEKTLERLADAAERQAAALEAMAKGNPAITAAAEKTEAKADTKTETKAEDSGPGYWKTPDGTEVGEFANAKEFAAAQKQRDVKLVKIPKATYSKLLKEIKERAAKNAETEAGEDGDQPTENDLIEAFKAYLPKDLDADERKVRQGKVRPFLDGKGVKKATELDASDYAEAIDFVNGLLAEAEGGGDHDLV